LAAFFNSTRRSPPLRATPKLFSDEQALYDYAVFALGQKMRTVAQLKQLLRRHVESAAAGAALIESVVARLKSHNYLSDGRFAAEYSAQRKQGQRLGRRRVAQDLLQKGVPAEVVTREVEAAYAETDEETQARAFLSRKRIARPADKRAEARLFRMLARAGFSAGVVVRILRKWNIEVDELLESGDLE
jgi:regulatory protein